MSLRVKVCGLTDEAGVAAAVAAGADALGFVLAPSPRQLTHARAAALLVHVPAGFERIAVFARATRDELEAALALGFDAVQTELGGELPALAMNTFCLPVLRDGPELEARLVALPPSPEHAPRSLRGALVLDGPLGGGRGIPVDVARAQRVARTRAIVLAGGLTPANVGARIRAIRPFAVDASSGLEHTRGVKDPALIQAFVSAARAADSEPDQREKCS